MVPIFRGEVSSASATWKGTRLQMFDLSTEGGRTRLRQRSPLRLEATSPPRLLGIADFPAVPGLTSHSTPMLAPLSTSSSLCRQLDQQPKCRLKLLSSVFTSSSEKYLHIVNFLYPPRGYSVYRRGVEKHLSLFRLNFILSMDPHGSRNVAMHHTWLSKIITTPLLTHEARLSNWSPQPVQHSQGLLHGHRRTPEGTN